MIMAPVVPALSAQDISVVYESRGRKVEAVKSVSIDLWPGEVLAVVGESGSGKSTLARSILGMVPQATGSVKLGGESVSLPATERSRADRRKVGMVFQDSSSAFNPRFTVEQILQEPLSLLATPRQTLKPAHLLDIVGLSSSLLQRRPRDLSGGQRQRVGIARALAASPGVLICDEAVSALDVSVQAQILNLLSDLQVQNSLAILFITHDLSVVSYLADRIAVMYRGELLETGAADEILDRPVHDYTRKLLAAAA
ncbi:ABC transporter ATP-binding protein [Agrobacterium tumefaciens]|uniref:ABC transporter ATP-binding protein n=1 Tax=Agrobacterium tumefaciens TaxID=358 RepID=A0AA44F6E6_AGRTU|nr:ABC transporter ATP-binding protein [Agrobacterium tumefaciens]NSL21326.1 ABC transporter ATP-binding protein [Agrobacterium tumefaciens]NTB83898.1 ABC transporter ATP-binding protein [Agrobacterium tumefaciens]NTC20633.1 ABC transporter ATP-binding protein [Agrobacterium tumefaciens]NTC29369.1 ABC transporter ATP-binding protein [Agrobacterium tumefaciens]NTC57865.1 ABC transporter ATP-binding protein [Agrobacterium tumefaciens]